MKQQFNTYLMPDLIRRAKHQAIDDQLSLSDLTSLALEQYIQRKMNNPTETLTLQPIVHVKDMPASIKFYEALGAELLFGSRDGDYAQLKIGGSEIGLLAHPVNPEQGEGEVELCFESQTLLREVEKRLRDSGIKIVQSASDEAFGEQLQVQAPGGMLIKINRIERETIN